MTNNLDKSTESNSLSKGSVTNNSRGMFQTVYLGQTVDNLVINFMEKRNISGLSLAIVQAPYITRVVGYGLANSYTKQLVAINTVFNIGQITKAFTSVAVLQLMEEGKLQLDESLSLYLKEEYIPKKWSAISIRNLITHSSGLPDYTQAENFDFTKEFSPEEIISFIKNDKLLFEPNSQTYNSDTDFYLLGLVIEKASGMPFQEYVTKKQIEPLGLKNTYFISNLNTLYNEVNDRNTPLKHNQFLRNPKLINPSETALGYFDEKKITVPAKSIKWSATYSASGLLASAQDISTWDIALAGEILLKEVKNREFLYQSISLRDGKKIAGNGGWFFSGHLGMMEIKGNLPGFSSYLSRFTAPTELVCVTLLTNKEGIPDLDVLGRKIAAAFDSNLAAAAGALWSETLQSPYSVQETLDRIETMVASQGGTVFSRIDHQEHAVKAGKTLQDTQVLLIGNPAKGTNLMQARPAIALDLPLRIMATSDPAGQTWLSYTNPAILASVYHLDNPQTMLLIKQMEIALVKLCQKAVSPSTYLF